MVSILIFCHKKKEANILQQFCGYCMAMLGDEVLVCDVYWDERRIVSLERSWDMLFFEINGKEDLTEVKRWREQLPDAVFLIILGAVLLPEHYIVPSMRPDMVLRKPLDRQKILNALHQLLIYYYRCRERESVHRLMIRSGDEKRYFRYTQILYLEASNKKLILYSKYEKVVFYGSLREMENVLPEYFIRCHRSYIVNFMYISRLNLSKGILYVCEKFVIPISKTYKNKINIRLENNRNDGEREGIADSGK